MDWRERKEEETYSEQEVEARLKEELPHWVSGKGLDSPAAR